MHWTDGEFWQDRKTGERVSFGQLLKIDPSLRRHISAAGFCGAPKGMICRTVDGREWVRV